MDVQKVDEGALAVAPTREDLERLEAVMLTMPQAEIETEHTYGPGFYARTITIPKGVTLTGKVHSTEHIFMVIKGDITLVTENGRKRVQGPYQVVCAPGTKRAGYAHEDTVCTNIHITDETDLVVLERLLIDNSARVLEVSEQPKLED
jgi:quercetin dioxygenase-like cupin family protein